MPKLACKEGQIICQMPSGNGEGAEAHVAVVAGTAFGAGGKGHIRISCAARLYELEEAVGRIETFLEPV